MPRVGETVGLDSLENPGIFVAMGHVRFALSRLLMVWLVATFVVASVGMGASGAAPDKAMTHATIQTDMQMGEHCPSMDEAATHEQTGHTACAMTVCCFSDGPDLLAPLPGFEILPAGYLSVAERRLTQSEPERAKKPPKHT